MNGVHYVQFGLSGGKLLQLAGSVFALKQVFDGPVSITTDSAKTLPSGLLKQFDHVVPRAASGMEPYREGCQNKTATYRDSPWGSTLFLDSDTIPVGPLDEMFLPEDDPRLTVTQVRNHHIKDSKARFGKPAESGMVEVSHVEWLMKLNPPEVNTGVFSLTKRCEAAPVWERTTAWMNRGRALMHDEVPLHFVYPRYPHRVMDDRYNRMPVSGRIGGVWAFPTVERQVHIWHPTGNYYGYGQCLFAWLDTLKKMAATNWCDIMTWSPIETFWLNQAE